MLAIKAYEAYKKYNGKDGAQEIVLEATKLRFVPVFARIGRKLVSASLLSWQCYLKVTTPCRRLDANLYAEDRGLPSTDDPGA